MWGSGLIRSVFVAFVISLLLSVSSMYLHAAPMEDEDSGEPPPPIAEKEVALPPFPSSEALIPVYAGVTSSNRFFLDRSSLAIGDEDIVRFVLVTRSPSGVENVSFEGVRCQTFERRIYAVGRSDRTWSKSRNAKWMRISSSTISLPHWELARRYFCDFGLPVGSPSQILDAVRRGGPPGWLGT